MKFLTSTSTFLFICALALALLSASASAQSTGGFGIMPIVRGGTGANTQRLAVANLGVPGPVFNVLAYGAAVDGTTDDTTALASAYAAVVAAGGGTLYIPGPLKVSAALAMNSSVGVRVLGGERTTCGLIASSSTVGALLAITGDNTTIENLKLDGAYTSGAHGSADFGLINITGAANVRILGCLIVNSLDRGIRIRGGTSDTEIFGTRFSNVFCGIHSYSTSSADVPQRITIERCQFLSGWSNDGETGGIKLQTNPADNATSAGHRVSDCTFYESGQMGVEFWKGIANSVIADCTIEGTDWGVSLDGSIDITVTGCTVRRFSYLGIESASLTGDNVILGNTVDGRNSSGITAGTAGIITSNTAPTHLLISSNVVHHVPTGIQLQTTDKVSVVGNWIHDCTSYALNLKGSNYITVRANGFFGPFSPSHVWIETYGADITDITIGDNDFFGNAGSNVISIYDGVGTNTATNIAIVRNNTKGATTSANNIWSNMGAHLINYLVRQNDYTPGIGAHFDDDPADLAASYLDQSVKTSGSPSFAGLTVSPGGVNSAKFTLNGTSTGTNETGYVEWKQSGTLLAKISSFGTNKDLRLYTNGNSTEALWLQSDGTVFFRQWLETTEQGSEPAAPAANGVRIFAVDNGSGKTVLKVKFNTGAVQVLATQP